jgi:hypothetical protein
MRGDREDELDLAHVGREANPAHIARKIGSRGSWTKRALAFLFANF